MKRKNPIDQSKLIENEYRDYLKSEFNLADEKLKEKFEDCLAKEELFKGPYLSINLPFKSGKNLHELQDEGIVCKSFNQLKGTHPERPLYAHQEESLRKICAGHSAIITTGTGSGKTECFLYPILNTILKNIEKDGRKKGIKALFLYPMNALINDQIDRVRNMLKNTPEITFGFYTSETPDKRSDALANYKSANGKDCPENEIISREDIRNNPPDLLFTNYSMLEYLLIRPEDMVFLTPTLLDNWQFVVLDEAHTYHGALGIELSYLLRRVCGLAKKTPQFLLTSATLGSQNKSEQDILNFARNLTPAEFNEEDIVFSKRIPFEADGNIFVDETDFLEILRNYDNLGIVRNIASKYLPMELLKLLKVPGIVFNLLKADERVASIYKMLMDGPMLYEKVKNDLAKIHKINISDECLTVLIVLINRAELNKKRLFDIKFHSFIRPISGIYMTLDDNKEMRLTRTNIINKRKAFEIGHCRYCNDSYIIGKTVYDEEDGVDKLVQNEEIDIYDNYGNKSFSDVEYYLMDEPYKRENYGEDDEDDTDNLGKSSDYRPYVICTKCGRITDIQKINEKKCKCGDEFERTVYKVLSKKANLRNNIFKCISCGRSNTSGIVKTLHLGKYEGTAIVAQILYKSMGEPKKGNDKSKKTTVGGGFFNVSKRLNSLEEKGQDYSISSNNAFEFDVSDSKQILMFSDGRQQASFGGSFLQRNHDKMLRKRLLWEAVSNLPEEKRDVLGLVNAINRYMNNEELLPDELDGNTEAWLAVLFELLKVDGVFSCEGLGLTYFALHFVDDEGNKFTDEQFEELFSEILQKKGHKLNLSGREIKDYFNVIFDYFKFNCAISYRSHVADEKRIEEILQYRKGNNAFQLIKVESGKAKYANRIKSFIPLTNRGNKVLEFTMKAFSCNADIAKFILEKVWECMLKGKFFEENGNAAYQIPAEKFIAKSYLDEDVHFYKCSKCGTITPYNVQGLCVTRGCDGKLEEIIPDEFFEKNYYRKEDKEKYIEPMIVEEHTAQIERNQAKKIQQQFKNKEINILSCSTTFEMGIDIGDLETVFMRNIPPRPDNYIQRAGRAGRGFDSASYILTYCSEQSHDYTYFLEPEKMISGFIEPPHFNTLNKKILLRHLMAASWGFFFKSNPQNRAIYTTLRGFCDKDGINQFKSYIESKPKDLQRYLDDKIIPSQLKKKYSEFKWFEEDVNSKDGLLNIFTDNITQIFNQSKDSKVKVKVAGESDVDKGNLNNLINQNVITVFSQKGLIPKYGFPVDVVDLTILEKNAHGFNDKLNLNRDLKIAIAEYAPDSEVVAGGVKYVSRYLKLPGKGKRLDRYHFFECESCKKVNLIEDSDVTNAPRECHYCKTYQEPKTQIYVEPRWGFLGIESEDKQRLRPVRSYSGEVTYIGGGEKEETIKWATKFNLETSRDDELLIMNRSTFMICEECGYGHIRGNKISDEHKTPEGKECSNRDFHSLRLGHKFKTDVIKLDISELVDENGDTFNWDALRSFMYAFLEGMSIALQIERSDLDGLVEPVSKESFEVLFYDNVPGGAGHVKRLMNKDGFISCLIAAWHKVTQNCCDEDSACYSCLENYNNQRFHNILSRKKAQEVIKSIAADLKVDLE